MERERVTPPELSRDGYPALFRLRVFLLSGKRKEKTGRGVR